MGVNKIPWFINTQNTYAQLKKKVWLEVMPKTIHGSQFRIAKKELAWLKLDYSSNAKEYDNKL